MDYPKRSVWPDWILIEKIGEGANSIVYKAVRSEAGNEYYSAIKHISIPRNAEEISQMMADGLISGPEEAPLYYEKMLQEVRKEISTLYKLAGNSHIVSYLDHRIVSRQDSPGYDIFIRMELLQSLDHIIAGRQLGTKEIVQMGINICLALEELNAEGCIHQDVKPANIFMTEKNVFKLGDFGVADTRENILRTRWRKGTKAYMTPEFYKQGEVNDTTDTYALGLVMYQLLNNNLIPFASADQNYDKQKLVERRLNGDALPAPAMADKALSAIVLQACDYDAAKRWPDAPALRHALQVYQAVRSDQRSKNNKDDDSTLILHIDQERSANEFAYEDSGDDQDGMEAAPFDSADVKNDGLSDAHGKKKRKQKSEDGESENQGYKNGENQQNNINQPQKTGHRARRILFFIFIFFAALAAVAYGWFVLLQNNIYNNALENFNDEQYAEAREKFDHVKGYKDSDEYYTLCTRELAEEAEDAQQYELALKYYKELPQDYEDKQELINGLIHDYVLVLLEQGDIDKAQLYFEQLPEEYSERDALQSEIRLVSAERFYEQGQYGEAIELLKEIPDDMAGQSELRQKAAHAYAKQLIDAEDYSQAIEFLNDMPGDFDGSDELLQQAKYGYSLAHLDRSDESTMSYLQELAAEDYQNSREYYEELTAWQITITANTDEDRTEDDNNTFYQGETVYFHFNVAGGPPDEELRLIAEYYKQVFAPFHYRSDSFILGDFTAGQSGVCELSADTAGSFSFRIYDDSTEKLLAEKQIKVIGS